MFHPHRAEIWPCQIAKCQNRLCTVCKHWQSCWCLQGFNVNTISDIFL